MYAREETVCANPHEDSAREDRACAHGNRMSAHKNCVYASEDRISEDGPSACEREESISTKKLLGSANKLREYVWP